ncbi:MAG: hypothetical protein WBA93_02400 [Microcoleaceae cyanobacterium]
MQANQISQQMNQEKLEQLKALTKVMIVSILWQGSGLMESTTETKQDTTNELKTDSQTNNYLDKK